MIIYEPNRNWFRDLRNLTTSWTIRKILNGVFMVGALSLVACAVLFYFEIQPRLHSGIFSLLGIVLSILLVFRTNTAYDRWWEGRRQWGALINHTRSMAMMLEAALPVSDVDSRKYFARHIGNFSISLKEHLRKGVKEEELDLTEDETKHFQVADHKPNFFASLIYNRIHLIYKAGALTDADLMNLRPHHDALLEVLGCCERIKKTPIPFSYAVYIKVFVSVYGVMLPFGLYMDFGFYTVPLTMFIFFAMLGLELMAQEIEDPFGLDCNDLPTGDMSQTIRKNVAEILGQASIQSPIKKELYQKIF
jgi:putative membrane protein